MSNRTLFIATLFFLLSPWWLMGLGNAPEKPEKDIHVSEEVKIKQQQDQKQEQPEKPAAAETGKQKKAEKETAETQPGKKTAAAVEEKGTDLKPQKEASAKTPSSAEEQGAMMLNDQESLIGDQQRLYTRKGRVDPFEPFVNREQAENAGQEGEELKQRKPQTPLERIALSQLKLTAILQVSDQNKSIAMVEDQTGKGYIVNEGTYIGENGGQVAQILSDRIVIEEKFKDVFGKIAVREIEKKLQK